MLTVTSAATLQEVLSRLFAHRHVRTNTLSYVVALGLSETVSQAGGAYRSRSGLLFQHVRYLNPLSIPLVHYFTDYSMGRHYER